MGHLYEVRVCDKVTASRFVQSIEGTLLCTSVTQCRCDTLSPGTAAVLACLLCRNTKDKVCCCCCCVFCCCCFSHLASFALSLPQLLHNIQRNGPWSVVTPQMMLSASGTAVGRSEKNTKKKNTRKLRALFFLSVLLLSLHTECTPVTT